MTPLRDLSGDSGDGKTPLDPDESDGLIPDWIATRADLDRAEFENVRKGQDWAQRQIRRREVVDEGFIRALHAQMFGDVWKWAGAFRTSEKNIGLAPHRIATELRVLLDDARYWDENATYPIDERAVRLHHRLVQIHPFTNGNGRLTREVADLYLEKHGATRFTWGIDMGDATAARTAYLAALRAADRGDYGALTAFVRS